VLARWGSPLSPCADGSVDAYWKRADGTILMNFESTGGVEFFAELAGVRLKGTTRKA
jgi:hypothetical protein